MTAAMPGHTAVGPASLILASASPRRHELLGGLGLPFTVVAADIDETRGAGEPPVDYVARVAAAKVAAVASRLGDPGGTVVLGADTTVDLAGEILAKPLDDGDARRMLRAMSGRTHQVHTAVVVWRAGERATRVVTTDVTFAALDEPEIDWYLGLGEHADKAGAYALQGAGGALVARIDGSPSNVVGLPLPETVALLRAAGVQLH